MKKLFHFSTILLITLFFFSSFSDVYATKAYIENTSQCVQMEYTDNWTGYFLGFNYQSYPNDISNCGVHCMYDNGTYYINGDTCGCGWSSVSGDYPSVGDILTCELIDGTTFFKKNGTTIISGNCGNVPTSGSYAGFDSGTPTNYGACSTPTPTPTPEPTATPTLEPTPTTDPTITPTPTPELYKHVDCVSPVAIDQTKTVGFINSENFITHNGIVSCPANTTCNLTINKWEKLNFGGFPPIKYGNQYVQAFAKSDENTYINTDLSTVGGSDNISLNINSKYLKIFATANNVIEDEPIYNINSAFVEMWENGDSELSISSNSPNTNNSSIDLANIQICLYYTNNNPVGATVSNDNISVGYCIIPTPFSISNLNIGEWIGFYWCQFKDWFTGLFIFNPTDVSKLTEFFNNYELPISSNLTDIIIMPLTTIQSITQTSCTTLSVPLPFLNNTNLDLPCPRKLMSDNFPTLITLWDIISTGFIGYWIVIRIFSQVKNSTQPDDSKITITEL